MSWKRAVFSAVYTFKSWHLPYFKVKAAKEDIGKKNT